MGVDDGDEIDTAAIDCLLQNRQDSTQRKSVATHSLRSLSKNILRWICGIDNDRLLRRSIRHQVGIIIARTFPY